MEHPGILHVCEDMRSRLVRYRTFMRWALITGVAGFIVPVIIIFLYLEDSIPTNIVGSILFMTCVALLLVCYFWLKKYAHLGLPCPHCIDGLNYLSAPWVCGVCYKKNTHPIYPTRPTFLEPCRFCKKRPAAIHCVKCSILIPLDSSFTSYTKATAWFRPPVPPKPPVIEERPPKLYDEDLR